MTQQNPNPQAEDAGTSRNKNKRPRPFFVESRHEVWWRPESPKEWTDWRIWGRYRTAAERDQALENLQRKYSPIRFEFRAGGEE